MALRCALLRRMMPAAVGLPLSSKVKNHLLHMEEGKLKERMMSSRRIPMMTEDEIQTD
jgi:hypothetical protein